MTESGSSSSLVPLSEHGPHDQQQLVAQFTGLIEESRGSLYACIFALVPQAEAAEEIFQETALYLWKEFEQFEPGTSFMSWARAVAFNRVRDYRHQRKRESVVLFDPQLLEQLAAKQEKMQSELDDRWDQFAHCMAKLRSQDQKLYETFYTTRLTAEELAKRESRSVHAIRKSIHKIRRQLYDCVGRQSNSDSEN